mgnify:CR=1 FL=1
MKFYIDTEFNGYKGELISMALIGLDGVEWYESVGCENPDPWVAEHVMPIIHKSPISKKEMQNSLQTFLSGYNAAHIIADWPEDIAHFCQLLITGPGTRIDTPALTLEVRRDFDDAVSLMPHNALSDARAMRKYDMRETVGA